MGALGVLAAVPALLVLAACNETERELFEAAFQGRCGHGSPCEQLCYELHDGMYECDCKPGFELRDDGYSCHETNSSQILAALERNGEDVLYQKDAVVEVELISFNYSEELNVTTQGPSLEQKLTETSDLPQATLPLVVERSCNLDCGPGGGCAIGASSGAPFCLCPLGMGGERCQNDQSIESPRFTGSSWLAFGALRSAYKHVQVILELRPEAYDGIFFLTGERDDMTGDFMALLLHQGFVEFRFDCGSGLGVVRSEETVLLNQWNHVTLYRHRWDAWLQLNGGKHIQGRSKGLFSRITFREPLFIGGAGNTTGLSEKLPVVTGLKGCIRNLEINDHTYKFALEPSGESLKGYGVEECTADRCSHVPCQHGGKCLTSKDTAVCLCPLGFSGDLCETRVDLEVPSFNGSSYLRYSGLGDDALTWLDLEVTLKPTSSNGLVLYNGQSGDGSGDYMILYLTEGRIQFSYNLGTGTATATSRKKVSLGEWHHVKVSRTGRLAILEVDDQPPLEVLSPGAFTQLSLPQNLYLGGIPNFNMISRKIRTRSAFVGCIQKILINGRRVPIIAEALGGVNVDNCPHPCVAKPCGEDGDCIPEMDYFACKCKPGYVDQLCSRGPPSFRGRDSYIHFNDSETLQALSYDPLDINVRFKASSREGLVFWLNSHAGNFISLGLERGALVFRFMVNSEETVIVHNSSIIHDNLWHRVKAVRNGGSGSLVIDNGRAVTTQSVLMTKPRRTHTGLYIGGLPQTSGEEIGVRGCIADFVLNTDYNLQLTSHSQFGHNVGECEV